MNFKNRLHILKLKKEYERFLAAGNLPWTPGYQQHKEKLIREAIGNAAYDPYNLPAGYGWRLDERIVEYPWFLSRLPSGPGRLLDAGSVLNFFYLLMAPKIREKKVFISTLAPESFAAWQHGFSYVYEDLRDSCFRDDYFDSVCCLSTLEHVGLDNTMLYTSDTTKNENTVGSHLEFLLHIKRILKPGGTLFLSVPFGEHVNHGWFQIFNSKMIDELTSTFAPSATRETVYRYREDGWTVSNRDEAKDATYFDIHKRKDYDSDYAAASRAVICLELTK